jgi:hypothetical protein
MWARATDALAGAEITGLALLLAAAAIWSF